MFGQLSDRLANSLKSLRSRGKLTEADIERTVKDIRTALLDADVALPAVKAFTARIRERAAGADVAASLNPAQTIVKIVHDELVEVLGGETRRLRFAKHPPTVIMLVGLQGAGKTTLAGKLAKPLKEQGNTPLLIAADLQRPNAVDQLKVVGERAGVATFAPQPGTGVGDPVAVAREGVVPEDVIRPLALGAYRAIMTWWEMGEMLGRDCQALRPNSGGCQPGPGSSGCLGRQPRDVSGVARGPQIKESMIGHASRPPSLRVLLSLARSLPFATTARL